MRVVIGSNVLVAAIGRRSVLKPVWNAFVAGMYQLIVTEEIIHEYGEILNRYSAHGASGIVMKILAESDNVIYQRIYYAWNVITADPDDNKFFDAAVAGNADFLVTNDTDFNEAKKLNFPVVKIINASDFLQIVEALKRE